MLWRSSLKYSVVAPGRESGGSKRVGTVPASTPPLINLMDILMHFFIIAGAEEKLSSDIFRHLYLWSYRLLKAEPLLFVPSIFCLIPSGAPKFKGSQSLFLHSQWLSETSSERRVQRRPHSEGVWPSPHPATVLIWTPLKHLARGSYKALKTEGHTRIYFPRLFEKNYLTNPGIFVVNSKCLSEMYFTHLYSQICSKAGRVY